MEATARKLISSGSPFEPRIGFSRAVRVGPFVAAPGDLYGQTKRCLEIIAQAIGSAASLFKASFALALC